MTYPTPERRVVFDRVSQVQRTRQEYLDPGRVPLGLVSVLAGYGGLGKSQWACDLAGRVTRGELGDPAAVVIATAEDSLETTVKPRLEAVQADLDLIAFARVQMDDGLEDGIVIPDDVDLIEQQMVEFGARLLIVDPLVAHLPGEIDSHKDQSVRRAIAPLYRMAQHTNCAVLAVIHLNKASGMQPLQRLSGSGAFGNAARSVLLLDRDPDDPDGEMGPRRVLAHIKSNVGPEMPSLLYRIEPTVLPATAEEPEVETSRLELIGESPHTGRELLNSTTGEERLAADEAKELLLAELVDGERHPVRPIEKAAAGLGISKTTLHRVRKALNVQTGKTGFGAEGAWEWWLPKIPSPPGEPAFLHKGSSPRVVEPSEASSENGLNDEEITQLGLLSLGELRERFE